VEVGVVAIIIIVAGAVIKACRDGKTTLACAMAFAVTDDIKRQERLWKTGSSWMRTSTHNIRRALVEGEIECRTVSGYCARRANRGTQELLQTVTAEIDMVMA
jgi:hypothetical protein